MARKVMQRASGQVTKVEGCEDIERILRDTQAIEKIVGKCVKIMEAVNVQDLRAGEAGSMEMAKLGLQAAKVVVDVHKFHVGVSTKTVESERNLELELDGKDEDELLEMIEALENKTGEKIIDVESVVHDGNDDPDEEEAVEG